MLLLALASYGQPISYSKNIKNWKFQQEGETKWHTANIPGYVHLDLFRNKLIDDPYKDNNELTQQWVEEKNWIYTSEIEVSAEMLEHQHLELIFEGLDTYASIYINNIKVKETNNMFRSWTIDVKNLFKSGGNELKVVFESPITYNRQKVENYPFTLPAGNETVKTRVSPFCRKAGYQFGWDWGPRFVSMGIWKPVKLQAWNDLRILNTFVETQIIENEKANLRLEVLIESSEAKGHYKLDFNGKSELIQLEAGKNILSRSFTITQPELWWPNGYGNQHLYEMEIKVTEGDKTVARSTATFGVRTVELINQKDSIGTSFYFKVNGQSIFMKGANYIPQDVFLSRVSNKQYENIILKAKKAYMNMLRVWGGGIYEKNIFYDLCDKHGILVWQDFMFAGSMYPSDYDFKLNITEEFIENINRLRSHPCIALWCGNNEMQVAWENWGWQQQYNYGYSDSLVIWNNYLEIFHNIIPNVLQELYPTANYTTTSPLSNWGTAENFNHSSMHYWGVWHGKESFDQFKNNVGRFMVEYGFQSFPNYKSLKKVVHDSSMYLQSEVMTNRQKSYIGNSMITKHSEKWFGKPIDFKNYVENSQKTQALAMQNAIMQHRMKKPHCMGTLFWQMNDCWQGPSWSVMNYNGKPKLAYETVKTWYAPVIVIPKIDNNELFIILCSDRKDTFKGTVEIYLDDKKLDYKDTIFTPEGQLINTRQRPVDVEFIKLRIKEGRKVIWETKMPFKHLL